MMNDSPLPIQLSHNNLFADNDQAGQRLMNKLEGWLNFQTLLANWFNDESRIINISICIEPEATLDTDKLTTDNWQLSHQHIWYLITTTPTHYQCVVMLEKSRLEQIMNKPESFEDDLKRSLTQLLNMVAEQQHLSKINA